MPGTLKRSPKEAQDAFAQARDNAVRRHGEGDEAQLAAYTKLKEKFEKRGDHWIAKIPGPADPGDGAPLSLDCPALSSYRRESSL